MRIFKHLLFLPIIVLLIVSGTNGQVLNNSFEDWSNDEPVNWLSSNAEDYPTLVKQSGDAHTGSFALKLESMQTSGVLFTGYITSGAEGNGTPVSQRYEALNLHYKFVKNTVNTYLWVIVSLSAGEEAIGGGAVSVFDVHENYTQLSVPLTYIDERVPDNAVIFIWIGDTNLDPNAAGSFALLDDISFGSLTTDVEDEVSSLEDFSLEQNFPNPFNPSTKIKYSVPTTGEKVTLKVYNILGNEVATLVNEQQSAGVHSVDFNPAGLASGTYIYKLQAGDKVETRKMIYLK